MGIMALQHQFAAEQFDALTAVGETDAAGPFDFVPTEHSVQVVTTGAPSAVSVQLQGSLDGVNFVDVGDAQSVPSGGLFAVTGTPLRYVRISLATLTGGTSPAVTTAYLGVRA